MPRVEGKHFKYTKEGIGKAKRHAKATGKTVDYDYSGPEMKGTKPGRSTYADPKPTPRTGSKSRRNSAY